MLAAGATRAPRGVARRRFALAHAAGGLAALGLLLATLAPRGDLRPAVQTLQFWLKEGFVVLLSGAGVALAARCARPGAAVRPALAVAALCVGVLWLAALAVLLDAPPQARLALLLGDTWHACPWLIAGLSLPLLAAQLWAMRGLAPTRLGAAGFAAGLAAGAVAAVLYSLHCSEDAPPFIALWYVLGILVPAGAGAALGPRLLRW